MPSPPSICEGTPDGENKGGKLGSTQPQLTTAPCVEEWVEEPEEAWICIFCDK
jgi:hypothetical protein